MEIGIRLTTSDSIVILAPSLAVWVMTGLLFLGFPLQCPVRSDTIQVPDCDHSYTGRDYYIIVYLMGFRGGVSDP